MKNSCQKIPYAELKACREHCYNMATKMILPLIYKEYV